MNTFFQELPRHERPFPEFDDVSEGQYCSRVALATPKRFALMDQKMIPIGGAYGTVEFCDLLTADRDLIHIKRYGASSVLSHLFSQGVVSAEAFRADSVFRQQALDLLPAEYRSFTAAQSPGAGDFRVVYAVISDKAGDLTLPFFSRVNIRHACRRLDAFGFRTAVAKIPVAATRAKLKRLAQI